MKTELICITCPLGCHLDVERLDETTLAVSGNRCPRGVKYANEELLAPKRVVSATARIVRQTGREASLDEISRLPVRTTGAYPKEGVPELLKAVYALALEPPIKRGDVLIGNYRGSGIDVIAARTVQ